LVRILGTSKVFQEGKTVIPAEVRQKLGVNKEGDMVVWMEDEKRVYVMSSTEAAEETRLMKPHWLDYPKGETKG